MLSARYVPSANLLKFGYHKPQSYEKDMDTPATHNRLLPDDISSSNGCKTTMKTYINRKGVLLKLKETRYTGQQIGYTIISLTFSKPKKEIEVELAYDTYNRQPRVIHSNKRGLEILIENALKEHNLSESPKEEIQIYALIVYQQLLKYSKKIRKK